MSVYLNLTRIRAYLSFNIFFKVVYLTVKLEISICVIKCKECVTVNVSVMCYYPCGSNVSVVYCKKCISNVL